MSCQHEPAGYVDQEAEGEVIRCKLMVVLGNLDSLASYSGIAEIAG